MSGGQSWKLSLNSVGTRCLIKTEATVHRLWARHINDMNNERLAIACVCVTISSPVIGYSIERNLTFLMATLGLTFRSETLS